MDFIYSSTTPSHIVSSTLSDVITADSNECSYYDDDAYLIPSYDEFDALCMHYIIENITNGSYDDDNIESIIAPLTYSDLLDDDGTFAHDIMDIMQSCSHADSHAIGRLKRACQMHS